MACATSDTGTIACWGPPASGFEVWRLEPPAGDGFRAVVVGSYREFACAIAPDSTVACWGYDTGGNLDPPRDRFLQISAGAWGTCGVRENNELSCWGPVYAPPEGLYQQVSVGWASGCALTLEGEIRCWGRDDTGVVSGAPSGRFARVVTSGYHACALDAIPGELTCWGDDSQCQSSPPGSDCVPEPYEEGPVY